MPRRLQRSNEPLAYGVVLFGHVGPELRRRLSALIPALDRVAGCVLHFFGHGPRSHHVGEHAARDLEKRGLFDKKYIAEWDATMECESGRDAAIAEADETFIASHGISRSQMPCIAFFSPGESAPFAIVELDPQTWETPSRFKLLSSVLLARFEESKVVGVVSRAAVPTTALKDYIRRISEEVAAISHDPDDPITITVAIREFCVARSTIGRLIAMGTIKSYRPPQAGKTARHRVSRKELAAIYPPRSKSTSK